MGEGGGVAVLGAVGAGEVVIGAVWSEARVVSGWGGGGAEVEIMLGWSIATS